MRGSRDNESDEKSIMLFSWRLSISLANLSLVPQWQSEYFCKSDENVVSTSLEFENLKVKYLLSRTNPLDYVNHLSILSTRVSKW